MCLSVDGGDGMMYRTSPFLSPSVARSEVSFRSGLKEASHVRKSG